MGHIAPVVPEILPFEKRDGRAGSLRFAPIVKKTHRRILGGLVFAILRFLSPVSIRGLYSWDISVLKVMTKRRRVEDDQGFYCFTTGVITKNSYRHASRFKCFNLKFNASRHGHISKIHRRKPNFEKNIQGILYWCNKSLIINELHDIK